MTSITDKIWDYLQTKVASKEDISTINARLSNIETRLGFIEERLNVNERIHVLELEMAALKAKG